MPNNPEHIKPAQKGDDSKRARHHRQLLQGLANKPPSENVVVDDDFLRGAAEIAAYLRSLGLVDVTEDQIYYLARSKKIAVGRFGKELISSKRRLKRDLCRAAQVLT
jgi:hypothetical protein